MIVAEKLDVQVGAELKIDEVLLVGSEAATVVGRPTVPIARDGDLRRRGADARRQGRGLQEAAAPGCAAAQWT